jgi:acyl carrier protein
MEDKILDYINKLFGKEAKGHESYCAAPFEDCTCKRLEGLQYDTQLIGGGYIDSFSMVAVLMFIEKEFKIKVSDKDAVPANFNSVNLIAALVRKYQEK